MKLIAEGDAAAAALRRRLDAFYSTADDYTAFSRPSDVGYFWRAVVPGIEETIARRGVCRVLEFGAGRSGLGCFLRECGLRAKVRLTLHDVTSANAAWLRQEGDEVRIGPVPEIDGRYDVILSSFVVEHMTDPQAALEALWRALEKGGRLYLVCPRYDWPFYLPPACDHLASGARMMLAARVLVARLRTWLKRRPAFLLLDDAAIFHLQYTIDRDAVHLASWLDMSLLIHRLEGVVSALHFNWLQRRAQFWTLGGMKAWFVTRYLLLGLMAQKP